MFSRWWRGFLCSWFFPNFAAAVSAPRNNKTGYFTAKNAISFTPTTPINPVPVVLNAER